MERSIVDLTHVSLPPPRPLLCLGSDTVCKIETPLVTFGWQGCTSATERGERCKVDVLAAAYTLDPLPGKAIFAKALTRSARRAIAERAAIPPAQGQA